jgi:Flp pilus assembly protein TadG
MNRRVRITGLAVVEAAIVLPLLLLLMLAVGEVGRAFIQYTLLSHRVTAAARFVADNAYQGTTGVPTLTNAVASQARNLVIYGTTVNSSFPAVPGLLPNMVEVAVSAVGIVTVSVTYNYRPVVGDTLPTFGLGDDIAMGAITFRPRVVMRAL